MTQPWFTNKVPQALVVAQSAKCLWPFFSPLEHSQKVSASGPQCAFVASPNGNINGGGN